MSAHLEPKPATSPKVQSEQAFAACEALVREGDRDRWLATLLAPAEARPPLHALYAFSYEIARVRDIVSDPLPGEVRHQWWRDALEGEARGDVKNHPIASALITTIVRYRLPRAALVNLIEARAFDLYDDPMPTLNDLEGYCGETSSILIRLAAMILGGDDRGLADPAGHAGVAYALTGLLRALPWHSARGQVYMPVDLLARFGLARNDLIAGVATPAIGDFLAEMRALVRRHRDAARKSLRLVPAPLLPAFLPLVLVDPYLDAMERRGYDPFKTVIDVPQWRRQWTLWTGTRRLVG